jgi:[protein-PII] uridylyltransferase
MTDLPALRTHYRAQKAALLQSLAASGTSTRGVRTALGQLSDLADETLTALWTHAGFTSPFALLAVGGFGRAELFPYSDIDVLVLLPNDQLPDQNEALKSQIEGFIGSCWDVGLDIGSSVRTVDECLHEAAQDVTVQTSLIESRLITGNAAVMCRVPKAIFCGPRSQSIFCGENA